MKRPSRQRVDLAIARALDGGAFDEDIEVLVAEVRQLHLDYALVCDTADNQEARYLELVRSKPCAEGVPETAIIAGLVDVSKASEEQ